MGIISSFRKGIASLLDPERTSESTELQYLREIYYNTNGNFRLSQWYRILNEGGDLVGFGWSCSCGAWYQLLSIVDWLRDYDCPRCKNHFSLHRTLGITADTPEEKRIQLYRSLPARPRVSPKRLGPTMVFDKDLDVEYESSDPTDFEVGWRK